MGIFSWGWRPSQLVIPKIIEVVQNQINADPRTKSGFVFADDVEIKGDQLILPARIEPLTGNETIIDVGSIISGQLNQGA